MADDDQRDPRVKLTQPEDGFAVEAVIPVVHEVPVVGKRTVETGRARIDKQVVEREVVIDEPLLREEVRIERISIGREVSSSEGLPGIRYEGDTLIVPVLEEVPVVVKKVVLTEEIRITRVRQEMHDPQTVKVRVEQVSVERTDGSTGTPPKR